MTDDERRTEGAEEAIEDLEAPADAQSDVKGGGACIQPTCVGDSSVGAVCMGITCKATTAGCAGETHVVVIRAR